MASDTEPVETSRSDSLESLRGLRLGRCSRRILLLAPLPDEEASVIPPERTDRAAVESHRRAMRSLAAKELVELTWIREVVETKQERRAPGVVWNADAGVYETLPPDHVPVLRAIPRRAVKLTSLGQHVVDRLRPVLENGRRIRWDLIVGADPE